jgi:hypothetical protein
LSAWCPQTGRRPSPFPLRVHSSRASPRTVLTVYRRELWIRAPAAVCGKPVQACMDPQGDEQA